MKFTETDLDPAIIESVRRAGFETLTEIQEKCLAPGLEGRDIAGISQTGTGKTVAFLLPIVHRIYTETIPGISTLILTPTRELCVQISEELIRLTAARPLNVCTVYGGEGYVKQEAALKTNPDLIVATPGRLIDYIKQNKVDLSTLRFLVLDEADRMFDMGFIRDIRFIMKKAPTEVQTMLFSATLSYYIMRLASDYMKSPVEVRIESESVAVDKIEQNLLHLGRNEKMPYLVNLLLNYESPKAIIFTNLKTMVPVIATELRKFGIAATGISSLLDQKKRLRLLKDYKLGHYSVLVATDVASRGLDVDDITHVVNYDLPQDSESYVHRIGRTARAGKSGISVTFCSEADYEFLPRIERYLGMKIPVGTIQPEYLQYPAGEFTPFVDAHGVFASEGERRRDDRSGQRRDRDRDRDRRGSGGGRRRGPRPPRRGDARPDERRKERVPERSEREIERPRAPVHAGGGGDTVREQDRMALLNRMARQQEGSGSDRDEQRKPPRSKKSNRKPTGRRDESRRSGKDDDRQKTNRPEREERQPGQGRSRRRGGRDRNRRDDRRPRDRRDEGRAKRQPPKKEGVLSKVLSLFSKKK